MKGTKGVIVDVVGPGELTVVHFNLTKKPLENPKVRQALAHALDSKEFRESYGVSITGEALSAVPPDYLVHRPGAPLRPTWPRPRPC